MYSNYPNAVKTVKTSVVNTDLKTWTIAKWFIGLDKSPIGSIKYTAFDSLIEPTEKTHPEYFAYIGPFPNKSSCLWFKENGESYTGILSMKKIDSLASKLKPKFFRKQDDKDVELIEINI